MKRRHSYNSSYWISLIIGLGLIIDATASPTLKSQQSQTLYHADQTIHYTVKDETSLGEISIRLYGTTRYWNKIAAWNNISSPFHIKLGQRLLLKQPQKYSPKEGNEKLRKMWSKRLDALDTTLLTQKNKTETKKEKEEQEETKRAFLLELEQKKQSELLSAILNEQNKKTKTQDQSARQSNLEESLIKAKTALLKQDWSEACQTYEALRTEIKTGVLEERTSEVWLGSVRCLWNQKRTEEAKALAKELLNKKPELKNLPVLKKLLSQPEL